MWENVDSKTPNGIRKVPIADKCCHFLSYGFIQAMKTMKKLDIELTPHYCRHTFVSMLAGKKKLLNTSN